MKLAQIKENPQMNLALLILFCVSVILLGILLFFSEGYTLTVHLFVLPYFITLVFLNGNKKHRIMMMVVLIPLIIAWLFLTYFLITLSLFTMESFAG